MRTTGAWATWRRLQYLTGFAIFFLLIGGWVYWSYIRQVPTCFDNKQNGDEAGVDCGGQCVRICSMSVEEPTVKWSRSFRVTEGMYNAVAYVENRNREAASNEVKYTFTLYDDAGIITTRSGTTILPPNGLYPIFEGRIETGRRVPTKTFIDLEPIEVWQPASLGREQFTVVERELQSADKRPRLNALIRNESLEEAKQVEVVATIFDSEGTALASSRTEINNFAPRSEREIFFTWPEPIATTLRSCEVPTDVLLGVDVSGSMNDDQTLPPQPLTAVKNAAVNFVDRLKDKDQAGVVTFATAAKLISPLSTDLKAADNLLSGISIEPKEERGFTNTGEGVKAAAAELTSERHNENARKVLVLLTDGLATAPGTKEEAESYALAEATEVKSSGIEIYAIGLGDSVNMDFINAVASDPSHAYQALDAAEVDSIYKTITSSLCEEGAAVIDVVPKSNSGFVPLN